MIDRDPVSKIDNSEGAIVPPTPSELVARARAITPELIDRQAETEERSFYAQDTHEALKEAGLYRMFLPHRFGGYEVDVETFMRVVVEIAAACPSTAWQFTLGSAHVHAVASHYGEEAQQVMLGDGHFIAASASKPTMTAKRADGGWILNGTIGYASGLPYSTHFLGFVMRPDVDIASMLAQSGAQPRAGVGFSLAGMPGMMTFTAPRDTWRRLDDWGDTLGLRGSGSHSVCFENSFVSDVYFLDHFALGAPVAGGTVGSRLHGNPFYSGRHGALAFTEFAAIRVGMLRGAIEVYRDLLQTKMSIQSPMLRRAQEFDSQRWYGLLLNKYASAEALLWHACREYMQACQRNVSGEAPFDEAEEARLCAITEEASTICWDAMQSIILPTAGTSEFRSGKRLERIFRDMAMSRAHVLNMFRDGVFARGIAEIDLMKSSQAPAP